MPKNNENTQIYLIWSQKRMKVRKCSKTKVSYFLLKKIKGDLEIFFCVPTQRGQMRSTFVFQRNFIFFKWIWHWKEVHFCMKHLLLRIVTKPVAAILWRVFLSFATILAGISASNLLHVAPPCHQSIKFKRFCDYGKWAIW